ncbi:hypothetical protein EUTSA_v10010633mg [Eutrema salsugineum]|uniref:TF-B3 domain-containing protein n=1 Tax=Eutrema salsugineum TaxID=72664 RepID=V4LZ34_EUTSA|nr:B3 domain-containing protein REM20 [Eutrema salsugineum]ESQ45158.1 hypothetical protein EUTSA_v10010633mg [Eutrema salsugineum]
MSETEDDAVLPRFFKVFLSETSSESMRIPVSFNEHLEDPLPRTAKLHGTGGGIWTVGFTKRRKRVYFTDGWSKFAEDHDLKDGEFLTFVYDGYHTFEVSVYDGLGCKETRAVTEAVELSDADSDSDEEEEEDPSVKGEDDSSYAEDEEVSQSNYTVDSEGTESDSSDISDLVVTTNPWFKTNLKNRTYELLIPAKLAREYRLKFGESITYIDEEGTMVGIRVRWSDDRICFKGWDRICRRNRLNKQDQVICEMLHNRKLVHTIKIHIKRG